jgi:hypothetical protein
LAVAHANRRPGYWRVYLDQVLSYAGLPSNEAAKARHELADHLLSRVDDLEKQGASRDDAAFRAIYEHGQPIDVGYGLRPRCPWVDVRLRGTARGVLAVGPKAVGIFSCGIVSTGIVSCGVVSFGVLSAGLVTFALALGLGAISVGTISLGANAIGLVAAGLNSAGVLCAGINSIGIWVFQGQNALSYFDEKSAPTWLQNVGNMISWNSSEATYSLAPYAAILFVVILAAIHFGIREYKRVKSCHPWIFQ